MAHQADWRGPQGGSRGDYEGGRDRDMGRDMGRGGQQWGRSSADQYGMQSGGDWHRQGESFGPPYNQNAGQEWQQSEFGSGRGNEGQGNAGQGYYGSGMNTPGNYGGTGSWRDDRHQGNRGGRMNAGGQGDREYGWTASEGYNTQPYNSGGYYGGGGSSYYGRNNPDLGEFGYGNQGGQGGGRAENHAGRGPRNYRRSDDRILEDVNEELTRHPGIDASDIEVRVEQGEVTLTGTVDDRRTKRLAEDIAERCSGVEDVRNELRVEHAGRSSSRHGSSATSDRTSDREVPRRTEHETGRRGSHASSTSSPRGDQQNTAESRNASSGSPSRANASGSPPANESGRSRGSRSST